jgi:hypothetical protein
LEISFFVPQFSLQMPSYFSLRIDTASFFAVWMMPTLNSA